MIRSNEALYLTLDELIRMLADSGEAEHSSALRDAIGISSLPGEILGETRVQLLRLRSCPVYKRVDVRAKVDDALGYIDAALGP